MQNSAQLKTENAQERLLGKPLRIPISKIQRYVGQPRRYFNQLALERLADSMMSGPNGAITQEQPIKVCINPDVQDGYILIDGERRWRAFHIIEKRKGFEPLISAFLEEVKNPHEHFRKSMVSNLHREDLSDLDEAAALHQMWTSGTSKEALAHIIGKSIAYVDNYIKLHTHPDEVKALMSMDLPRNHRLNTTAAIDIARSTKNNELRIELANEVVHRSLSLAEARYTIAVKTGKKVGDSDDTVRKAIGFTRDPKTEYKSFKIRLSKASEILKDLSETDLEMIYAHREDEGEDRDFDAKIIADIGHLIIQLHKKVFRK